MLGIKRWFSKYGVVAPCAAVAVVVAGVAVVLQSMTGGVNVTHVTGESSATVDSIPQPAAISQDDVQRLVRAEMDAQRRLDEERKAAWRALLPGIAEGAHNRWLIAEKYRSEIDAMVAEVRDSIDAATYAEAICGWQSSWESLDGGGAHSRWALRQFHELVLDENLLAEHINERLQMLHQELTEFDNRLLTELGTTSSLSGVTIDIPLASCAWMTFQFEAMTALSGNSLDQAWVESGISYVGGKLLNALVLEMFSGTGKSSGTEMNSTAEMLIDFAADSAAGEIIQNAIGTAQADLARATKEWTQEQLTSLLSEKGGGVGWLNEMQQLVVNHENAVTEILLADAGVDREWAFNLMAAYYNAIANQEVKNE